VNAEASPALDTPPRPGFSPSTYAPIIHGRASARLVRRVDGISRRIRGERRPQQPEIQTGTVRRVGVPTWCVRGTSWSCRQDAPISQGKNHALSAANISSTAASARARISSSVRSCIGCGTKTRAGSKPSERDCASAACLNSTDATNTPGTPRASRVVMSCTLHVVHDPQSASASINTPQRPAISSPNGAGITLA